MAEVNNIVWGNTEYWHNALNYYSGVTDKEKAKFVSYDGQTRDVGHYLEQGRITANTQIDNSLSYCGLGTKSPYNRLTFYRGVEAYSYRYNNHNIPWTTYTENSQESVVTQVTGVTNFTFSNTSYGSSQRGYRDVPFLTIINERFDRFHSEWGPDSVIDEIALYNDGAETEDYRANLTLRSQFLGQIPVKNIVCYPKVVAINRLDTTTPTYKFVDLKTYLDTDSSDSYLHYPYVISTLMYLRTDLNGINGSLVENVGYEHNRNTDININSIALLKNLDMFKGMPAYYASPLDSEYIFDSQVIHYGFILGNSNGDVGGVPIYGLLTGIETNDSQHLSGQLGNCRYTIADIQSDEDDTWDMYKINYGDWQQVGANTPCVFTWAGGTPNEYVHAPTNKDNCRRWIYHEVNNSNASQFRETIRCAIACFGLFFVDGEEDINLKLDDENMMLGILEDGIGNGEYSHGQANKLQDQWKWDDMHENDYNPGKEPDIVDDNDYSVPMTYNNPWIKTPNHLYVLSAINGYLEGIRELYNKLWYVIDENYDPDIQIPMSGSTNDLHYLNTYSDFALNNFLTMNPIDSIVSIKYFPYDTRENKNATPTSIKLGCFNTQIPAGTAQPFTILSLGTAKVIPYFGNCWMDRLTEYTLYAPFCGTLKLDPNIYMGKTIRLDYLIDQITGACTCNVVITSDDGEDVHEDSLSGTCAVDIPITGINQATLQSQIFNANQQLKAGMLQTATQGVKNALTIGTSVLNKDVGKGINAAVDAIGNFAMNNNNLETLQYNLHHNEVAPRTVGASSPMTAQLMDYIPRILISKPVINKDFDETTYAQTKGYACLIAGSIGNHEGFVQMQNVKLDGISCNQREREMIRSLLASGIYANKDEES